LKTGRQEIAKNCERPGDAIHGDEENGSFAAFFAKKRADSQIMAVRPEETAPATRSPALLQ
jgi:hypothetical protein